MDEVLVVLIIFGSIAWIIDSVVNRRALHKERMKLIEKDGDLNELEIKKTKNILSNFNELKFGLMAIGLSLGCLLGSFLEQYDVLATPVIGYFFSISLFVGISLVLSHYLIGRKRKKEKV